MTFGFGRMNPVHRAFRMKESEIRKWQVYLLCLEFYHCTVDASGYGLLCNSMILSYRRLFGFCFCTPWITRTACIAIWCFDCFAFTHWAHIFRVYCWLSVPSRALLFLSLPFLCVLSCSLSHSIRNHAYIKGNISFDILISIVVVVAFDICESIMCFRFHSY